jgi:hypothetical protein
VDTHGTIDLRTWGAWLVGLMAFCAYALCLAPAPYFLDSAELAAATFGLGVAHPPGEVTALLWGKFFDLLPLGNVAFRAALAQATAGALAACLVYALTLEVAEAVDADSKLAPLTRATLAAATALMFAFAPGVVMVSNRAEVYALQTALSLAALWLAIRAATRHDARLALVAGFVIALGVANHSLIAGLVGLGAVTAAWPLLRLGRGRLLGWTVLAFLTGALIHLYLPMRAAALLGAADGGGDNLLWGDARGLSGLWWLLSAKTFVGKQAVVQGQATPWDLPFLPMEELGELFALLAPAGMYFLLRRRRTRAQGIAIMVAMVGSMVAALIGGLAPANPDNRGYLGCAFALLAVFSGSALLFGLTTFHLPRLRPILAALLFLGALTRFPHPNKYPGLRHATVAQAATEQALANLPVRAALFTNHFETAFLVGYQRLVEASRPDVAWAHLAFAGGPGYGERMSRAQPDLSRALQAYRERRFSLDVLRPLDSHRPVRIEADVMLPPELRRQLVPVGDFWGVSGHDPLKTMSPWMLAAAQADPQALGYLGWRSYIDAVWSCDRNDKARIRQRFAELDDRKDKARIGQRFAELDALMPKDARFAELKTRCAALATVEAEAEEPAMPEEIAIRIVPRGNPATGSLILSFCYSPESAESPRIHRVRIGPVSGQTSACTFSSEEGATLTGEWHVGRQLPGFRMVGCGPLDPGEYEVYVYGCVGDGVIRMSIEPGGGVFVVPWDRLSEVDVSPCPTASPAEHLDAPLLPTR